MIADIVLLAVALSSDAAVDHATTHAPEQAATANPWVEPARDVLVQYCGSCHRPGLPTTNTRALAVFNLHETVWYQTMSDDQLRELRRRAGEMLQGKDGDRDTLVAFVDCELDHVCAPARKKESP